MLPWNALIKDPKRLAYAELHVAVLLFGLTAILGKLITLPALTMVWWRMGLTVLSLLFWTRGGAALKTLPAGMWWKFIAIGCIVAIHWLAFFGAIQWSNASITLVCMGTTAFCTALLEPLIMRHPVKAHDLLLGLVILPGMALVAGGLDPKYLWGILAGLGAAASASLFSTLNKKYIHSADPVNITLLELGSGWALLTSILPLYYSQAPAAAFGPTPMDWVWLLVLSLLCTTVGYVLALKSLTHLSAFTANLTVNLEPVYGIFLAWVLLKENQELSTQFYLGGLVIVGAVLIHPMLTQSQKKTV